jgi:hypothetical protein
MQGQRSEINDKYDLSILGDGYRIDDCQLKG